MAPSVAPLFFFPRALKARTARILSVFLCFLCVLTLIFGETDDWAGNPQHWWYVPVVLAVDALLRFLGFVTPLFYLARETGHLVRHKAASKDASSVSGIARQAHAGWMIVLLTVASALHQAEFDEGEDGRQIPAKILLGVVALLSLVDAVTLVGGKLTLKFVMSTCAKRPMARPTAANARIVSGAEDGSGVQPSSIEIVTVSPKVPSDAAPESESKTDVEVAGAGPGAGAGAGAGAGVGAGSEAGAGADADASSVPKVNLATLYRNPDHHLSQEYIRKDVPTSKTPDNSFSIVRHFVPSLYAIPAGVGALALGWERTAQSEFEPKLGTPQEVWNVLAWIAFATFVLCVLIHIVQAALYPQKVMKQWQHPVVSASFGFAPITWMLLTVLAGEGLDSLDLNDIQTLVWIGALIQLAFTVFMLGRWLTSYMSFYMFEATLLIAPLGLVVSSIGLVFSDAFPHGYFEMSVFFFFNGVFMWLVFTPMIIYRVMTKPRIPELSHSTWIFIAAPAVINIAAFRLALLTDFDTSLYFGFVYFLSYYVAWLFFLVHCYMTAKFLFWRRPFDTESWFYLFPLGAFAAAVTNYAYLPATSKPFTFQFSLSSSTLINTTSSFEVYLAWFANGFASLTGAVLLLRYVYALVHKEVFRPIKKWGPLSFMQLTHVAFRVSFKKMVGLATKIKDESNAGARAKMCKKLFADFTMLKTITLLHARLEDSMLFPMVNLAFYDAAKPAEEQHEALDKEMEEFEEVVNGLVRGGDGGADELVEKLLPTLKGFQKTYMAHLLYEEKNLQTIIRKYVTVDMMVDTARRMWLSMHWREWHLLLPFVMNNLPKDLPRVKFCLALRWAIPDHIQLVGKIIYQNVPQDIWNTVSTAVPELIPRNVPGHFRLT